MFLLEDIRKIYTALNDEISRHLYIARLSFSVSDDLRYMIDIPPTYRNLNADIELFAQLICKNTRKRKVIFGAGDNGKNIAEMYSDLGFFAFIDNYRTDTVDSRTALPIYSLERYKREFGLEDSYFIVSVSNRGAAESILNQLLENDVRRQDIVMSVVDYRNNTSQYFDFFVPNEHESFVDCGCYDGATVFRFVGWCGSLGYDNIWSFEPDKGSYEKCRKVLQGVPNCTLYPYGTSDVKKEVCFMADGTEGARIVTESEIYNQNVQKVTTVSLDEMLCKERITYIKMDIEGAEYEALKGASHIIKAQKPRLAISIYHQPEQCILIPKLLLELRPDYKLYIRQYGLFGNETILYAE